MKAFTFQRFGRIERKWMRDGLSEILATFILGMFIYGAGAQFILSRGTNPAGKVLAMGAGVTMSVYFGFNASGSCVNPCMAFMFCLVGRMKWRKLPVFVVAEFIGGAIAAATVYMLYADLIAIFDGGERQVFGENATAHIFTTFPAPGVSTLTMFFDIAVGTGLLTSCACAIIDANNAQTANGLIPVSLCLMLYTILMSFGLNTMASINPALDLPGRIFAYFAGYGSEVFSAGDYFFWIPHIASYCGTFLFVFLYQIMIANHLVVIGGTSGKNEEESETLIHVKSPSSQNLVKSSGSPTTITNSQF